MAKQALMIIDMLNDFVREGAPLEVPSTRKVLPVIKREIEAARAKGVPVIYICDAHARDDREFSKYGWPAHGVVGTKGSEVVDEIRPMPGDIVIKKNTYSAFFNTTLYETLGKLGVESIILTGCVTHICILFTAYELTLRDYKVTVIEGGVAGLAKEDHDAALRIMKNVMGVKII